ncbi:hypothetical protein [Streptomyces antarcticus]|uniref:hypothetical protein n=1 Tax=Streptomyces antarcticus TaxID=2996458 RepID=UPI00226F5E34|nr:hypothetical protein [Streptomyces sp. H34-AA3]MCY0945655.1 hypothetical protein [Streptomyces sp. H34-AA3]
MSAGDWGELHGPTHPSPPRKRRHARPDGNTIAGLLLTTGNVLGLAVLALSCADQADGASRIGPSITLPDHAPAEAQPPRGPANDTVGSTTFQPAARAAHTRACRCGSRPAS